MFIQADHNKIMTLFDCRTDLVGQLTEPVQTTSEPPDQEGAWGKKGPIAV